MKDPEDGPRVRKRTGRTEPFSERKLRRSLRRAGARHQDVERASAAVREVLARRPETSTEELYRIAFGVLRDAPPGTAARYGLQRAIQLLGPDGFAFERLVAALWEAEGWKTRTGVRKKGRFVSHEIDVVGRRAGETAYAECKFRQRREGLVDVRVAMYVYGRAADLEALPPSPTAFWLVTNGRFTTDALRYGAGMGLSLLSWNYPPGRALRERIDRAGLHPVTTLTALRRKDQRALLERNVVVCRQLLSEPGVLDRLDLSHARVRRALAEARALVGHRGDPATS